MSIIQRKKQNREYAKSVQIGVTFPSPERRAAVQQLIADRAEIEGANKGAIASRILTDYLIPLEGEEREIFLACLPTGIKPVYPQNSGINNALELAFSYSQMATGSRYSADSSEYLRFATKRAWKYGIRIHERIEGSDPRINLERDLGLIADGDETAANLFSLLRENRPEAYPFFNFALERWGSVKSNRNALSFLVYLCAACENRADSAEDRQELLETCAMAQATRLAKRQSVQSAARKIASAAMAKIPIANGSTLIIPGSWIVLNIIDAKKSSYAGVIEVRNSPDAPHVVFFTSTPVNNLAEDAVEEIFTKASQYAPILRSIKKSEVELSYNDDGGVANREEYNNSPRIGFFPIRDSAIFSDKNPAPYGAMIIRAGAEVPTKSD